MNDRVEFVRNLSDMGPEELISVFKECAKRKDRTQRDLVEAEIVSRLYDAKRLSGKIITRNRDVGFPGNLYSEHPFETQLKSPRIKSLFKQDHALPVIIFSNLCQHTLYRSERSVIGVVQLDLLTDLYSATPRRISQVLSRLLNLSNPRYFSDNPKIPQGRSMQRCVEFVNRMGWDIIKSEQPPLLDIYEPDERDKDRIPSETDEG